MCRRVVMLGAVCFCGIMPALANDLPVPAGVSATRMTFDDEFKTFVSSSTGDAGWMTAYPYEGESARALPVTNKEAEYYSDSSVGHNPFSIHDGILSIIADRAAPNSNPYHLPYTSGLMTTHGSFAQAYGYFEIRAKLPIGKGLWPAFWLLPVDFKDYHCELDIFEVLGDKPTTLYATTHDLIQPNKSVMQTLSVPDTTADFHTYGADWEPDTVTFFLDGNVIATTPTPQPMDKPMYILVNLAVGGEGSWPGKPDATTKFPAAMQIAYVRAFATAHTRDIRGKEALQ